MRTGPAQQIVNSGMMSSAMACSEIIRWINQPPDVVFAALLDFASYPLRCQIVRSVYLPERPVRPGADVTLRLPYMDLKMQIVFCHYPHTLALRVRESQRDIDVHVQCELASGGAQVLRRVTWCDTHTPGGARIGRIPYSCKIFDAVLTHMCVSAVDHERERYYE
jgi:hypothetical protein